MTCQELHDIVNKATTQKFKWDDQTQKISNYKQIPKHGLYIMLDNNEAAHGYQNRIVRIGIDTSTQDKRPLYDRLRNHYNENDTVFCRHVGCCILEQEGWPIDDMKNYYNRKEASSNIRLNNGKQLKDAICEYIRAHIIFCVIPIDDLKEREEMEKRLIEMVATCPNCAASSDWLGKKHFNDIISNGKLWNIDHVPIKINMPAILSKII